VTHTHTLRRTPLDEGSASSTELYLTTQQSQQTDTHTQRGIRTRNPTSERSLAIVLGHAASGIG